MLRTSSGDSVSGRHRENIVLRGGENSTLGTLSQSFVPTTFFSIDIHVMKDLHFRGHRQPTLSRNLGTILSNLSSFLLDVYRFA
jgi:hypothetical protein